MVRAILTFGSSTKNNSYNPESRKKILKFLGYVHTAVRIFSIRGGIKREIPEDLAQES